MEQFLQGLCGAVGGDVTKERPDEQEKRMRRRKMTKQRMTMVTMTAATTTIMVEKSLKSPD